MTPRLFLRIAGVEARRRMSYRADFWLNLVVGFAAKFGLLYFVWTAMFRESGAATMGGYTLDSMLVYYVAVLLVSQIIIGAGFESEVATDIYEGGLNRYLVFPTSYFWFKYAQRVGMLLPVVLQFFVFGGLFVLFSDATISLSGLVMCVVAIAVGHLLFFTMSFPLQNVAFWADNVWSLQVALRLTTSLLGGLMFPVTLFPDWLQAVNAWLPFHVLFGVPAEVLVGKIGFAEWLPAVALGIAWIIAVGLLDRVVWRRGNLQYSGIGI